MRVYLSETEIKACLKALENLMLGYPWYCKIAMEVLMDKLRAKLPQEADNA